MGEELRRVWLSCGWILLACVTAASAANCANETDGDIKLLRVTTILVPPYMQEKANLTNETTGNDMYEGFIKSLLDEISNFTGIPYQLQIVKDGRYGGYDPITKVASGMIGEVMNGQADVAAAPLMVTLSREKAVDFLFPFYSFEAAILMRERHPAQEPVIRNLEDLVNQKEVDFGTLKDGAIAKYLKNSPDVMHQEMWQVMNNNAHVFKDTNNKGVSRARSDSRYAYLIEGSAAEYAIRSEPCDLEVVNAGFFKRQYAFAVGNRSPLRDLLNEAQVELQSEGVLNDLYDEWFGNDCRNSAVTVASGLLSIMISMLVVVWNR